MFPLLIFKSIEKMLLNNASENLDNAMGQEVVNTVKEIVTFTGDNPFNSFWSVMNTGMNAIKPFGFALVVTYFLIFLFDAAAKEQITVESLIKVMIQLILVITLINNLGTIIMAFFSIEESMLAKANLNPVAGSKPTVTGTQIVDNMAASGMGPLSIYTQTLVIDALHWLAVVACEFAAISRILEIGWKVILAPIGVANCFEGGASSPGIRYLKGLFATILSGIALYAVLTIGFAVAADFMGGTTDADTDSILLAVVTMLSTAGAAIGVSGKIKEVVG